MGFVTKAVAEGRIFDPMSRKDEFMVQSRMNCEDCQWRAQESATQNLHSYMESGEAERSGEPDPNIQTMIARKKAGKNWWQRESGGGFESDEHYDTVRNWANVLIQNGDSTPCERHA